MDRSSPTSRTRKKERRSTEHPSPTREDLRRCLEHVFYEIDALVALFPRLEEESADTHLRHAVLEASIIHLRCLWDFFYRAARDADGTVTLDRDGRALLLTDVFATDYLEFDEKSTTALNVAHERANTEVGHITTLRRSGTSAAKEWRFAEFIMPLLEACCHFAKQIAESDWLPTEASEVWQAKAGWIDLARSVELLAERCSAAQMRASQSPGAPFVSQVDGTLQVAFSWDTTCTSTVAGTFVTPSVWPETGPSGRGTPRR